MYMLKKNVDSMQKQKLELQVELNTLLHSSALDQDKINELKSEILYLDKQIEKTVGKKEIQRQKELKNRQSDIEKINKNNYYNLKSIVKKISPMNIATNRMIDIIEKMDRQKEEQIVKVR